jgi:propanediol utilization protein
MKIPIEISARHVHLSEKDFEKLFGKTHKLKTLKKISQPKQFSAKQEVELINGKNKLKARIIGPTRKKSQCEISMTDAYNLKMKKIPPIRISGDLLNAPKITIQGKKGKIKIPVIIAKRHLHLTKEQAKKLKLKNKQKISIKVKGKRSLIFNEVIVRSGEGNYLAFQIDTDEGNAAGIKGKSFGEIAK